MPAISFVLHHIGDRCPRTFPKEKFLSTHSNYPNGSEKLGRRSRQERKEAGICRDCPNEAIPGRVRCSSCAGKHRTWRRHNTEQRRSAEGTKPHQPTPANSVRKIGVEANVQKPTASTPTRPDEHTLTRVLPEPHQATVHITRGVYCHSTRVATRCGSQELRLQALEDY